MFEEPMLPSEPTTETMPAADNAALVQNAPADFRNPFNPSFEKWCYCTRENPFQGDYAIALGRTSYKDGDAASAKTCRGEKYLTFIRLDICYAVNKVCQFMHALTKCHWAAVKYILKYLKGISSFSPHLARGSSLSFHFILSNNIDDQKSIGGYIVFFGTITISWKSDKQHTVARFSTEVKFKDLVDGTTEVLWLHYLLLDLCFPLSSVTTIWCDNLGATYLFANLFFHARTKYVEVNYHFVHDLVAQNEI
ncbi:hypothetical protein NC651_033766 [Populus alba x Populus x berolinensis]|nr:hypothetical protein NC651_033766 [Populus alba x Populus x berolinensis]